MTEATLARNAKDSYKAALASKNASTIAAKSLYSSKLTAAKLIGDT